VIENDGGPAFPESRHETVDEPGHWGKTVTRHFSGMTLRDYFAGQALTTFVVMVNGHRMLLNNISEEEKQAIVTHHAEMAYRMSDAMLAAREK